MSTDAQPAKLLPILLIDDDAIFAETLGRALGRRGYTVTICTSTSDAKRVIEQTAPERAVVDLRLPDGSGLCLVTALKQNNPFTSIVVLTGYGSIASAVEAMKLGAKNYLCKPVDADAVVAAFAGSDDDEPDAVPATDEDAEAAGSQSAPDQPLTVMRLEWEYINRVLAEHDGNISATARALSMHRRTLQRKLLKRPVRH